MNDKKTNHQPLVASHLSVVIAGSTNHTRQCAQALFDDPRFTITGILTPAPKPIGRKQILTENPLHQFAREHSIPVVLVEKKIDDRVKTDLLPLAPDLLLVVDFGYIVPQWLLDLPNIAPVNIHPSDLPKYRGSSPGQFALLFGETDSAVTLMVMDEKLDHGPIIAKLPFEIQPTWTVTDYYDHAFGLATRNLAEILAHFVQEEKGSGVKVQGSELQCPDPCTLYAVPLKQPDESPTPTARMLKREDGFVPFETLKSLLNPDLLPLTSDTVPIPFLSHYSLATSHQSLYDLWRGFHPWPGLWTTMLVDGQEKRMKLLQFHMKGDKLVLDEVQIEGKTPQLFSSVIF